MGQQRSVVTIGALSRRAMVMGGAAGVAAFILGQSNPSASHANASGAFASRLLTTVAAKLSDERATLVFYDSSLNRQFQWRVAQAVDVECEGVRLLSIRLSFDSRTMRLRDRLVLIQGSVFHSAAPAEQHESGHQLEAAFEFALSPASASDVRIILPFDMSSLFPADALDGVYEPRAVIETETADGHQERWEDTLVSAEVVDAAAPYALTLNAGWDAVSANADDSLYYRAPVFLRVENEGPHASASGHELVLRSDVRHSSEPILYEGPDAEGAPLDALTHTVHGNERLTQISLSSIEAGASLVFVAEWPAHRLSSSTEGVIAALAEVTSGDRFPLNRTDSVWMSSYDTHTPSLPGADVVQLEEV
ncbi:hypothetical protein [uncultured Agrococcus sp.]|uniref:hypothetical protein n=1 Tax=uncultured Agrococcus sp. TaxID=382258 RepID=UPI0025DE46E9|nr:hypothetical protein [uncultured Agrococcus sp.]